MSKDEHTLSNTSHRNIKDSIDQYHLNNANPGDIKPLSVMDKASGLTMRQTGSLISNVNLINISAAQSSTQGLMRNIELLLTGKIDLEKIAGNNRTGTGASGAGQSAADQSAAAKATATSDIKTLLDNPAFGASPDVWSDLVHHASKDANWLNSKMIAFFKDCLTAGHSIYVNSLVKGAGVDPENVGANFWRAMAYGSACKITKVAEETPSNNYGAGQVWNFIHWLCHESPEGNCPDRVGYPTMSAELSIPDPVGGRATDDTEPAETIKRTKPKNIDNNADTAARSDCNGFVYCEWDYSGRPIHTAEDVAQVVSYSTRAAALTGLSGDTPDVEANITRRGVIIHAIVPSGESGDLQALNDNQYKNREGKYTLGTGSYKYMPYHVVVTQDGNIVHIREDSKKSGFATTGDQWNEGSLHIGIVTNVAHLGITSGVGIWDVQWKACIRQIIAWKTGPFTNLGLNYLYQHTGTMDDSFEADGTWTNDHPFSTVGDTGSGNYITNYSIPSAFSESYDLTDITLRFRAVVFETATAENGYTWEGGIQ
jgi:hypothetical protein